MKTAIFTALLLLAIPFYAISQTAEPTPGPAGSVSKSDTLKDKADNAAARNASPAQANGYVRPDSKTRFKWYVNGMFGPVALGKTVVSAGYGTWRNSPEEWGDQWEGFGRRVASSLGKSIIKQTTIYGLDSALKLDSHYYRSEKKDFGSKLGNALVSTVTARNASGKRVVGFPRIAGTYASSIIAAEAWYPSRYDWKDGVKSGTVSLGLNAVFNIVKEFVWKK